MAKKQKTPLRRAVDYLIDQGKLNKDLDLLEMAGLKSRGTLSSYLSGTPSKDFLEVFQNKFSIDLADFEEDKTKNPQPVARDQEVIDLLREKVASLEAQVDLRDLVTSLSSVLKAFEGIESKLDGLVATALLKAEEPQKVGKSKKGRKSGKNEIGKPF